MTCLDAHKKHVLVFNFTQQKGENNGQYTGDLTVYASYLQLHLPFPPYPCCHLAAPTAYASLSALLAPPLGGPCHCRPENCTGASSLQL